MLGIDPALNRMPDQQDIFLAEGELLAFSDPDLLANKVDTGDHFGHRVLHLKTGVHFDEVEAPVFVKELNRTSAAIAKFLHGFRADHADLFTLCLVQLW